ncbi:MAG: OmpA family protein [Bacteroidetes bacterium]|nr:OmpA family protein [Bacteroidota bacterium]
MKRQFTLFLSALTLVGFLITQQGCSKISMQKANELKETRQYAQAADMYTKLAASKKLSKDLKQEAAYKAAECYRKSNEFGKAKRAYEKILRKEPKNTEALYQLGILTMKEAAEQTNLDIYKKAREYFTKYLNEVPGDQNVNRKIASCDSAESWLTQESRFIVTNFRELNTKYSDYSPMISDKKDNAIFFVSDREGGYNKKKIYGGTARFYSDVWMVEQEKLKRGNFKWGKPKLVPGALNAKFNDGVQDFDRRYSTIYFTRCNGTDGKTPFCKIYEAKKRGNDWVEVTVLPFTETDSANYAHPALSPDGNKLYFTSDREGGYGGYDLYVVNYIKRGHTWSDPVNLGNTINTEKDEMFPYYNSHDNSLYFASNGHIGMGGLDIFKSEGAGNDWIEPENLRFPLNTGADDFGITFDNNNQFHGYFSSNRPGGRGEEDIYEFKILPLYFKLTGTVTDCKTGKPLPNSLVEITNDLDTVKISLRTNEDGDYDTVVLAEKATYKISVTNREAYYFDAEDNPRVITTVGLKKSHTFIEDFCLNPQLDFAKVLPIFYDLDKANIKPAAAKVLSDSLLPLLLKYPKIRIELGSHTDCRSSYAYNISLSQRRADSAVSYLIGKGIDPRRIIAKGYGESQLINDCACEGRDIVANTKYDLGLSPISNMPIVAKKKIESGDQYIYKAYDPSEIKTINTVKYVPCDEYQHSQNRRTTFRILDVNFDSSMKVVQTDDPNNQNAQIVIVKLDQEGNNYKGQVSANNVPAEGPTIFIESNRLEISLIEVKNLINRKALTPDALKGVTPQQIISGKIPPGASVVINPLLIGTKDLGKAYNNVELQISTFNASFRFGFKALDSLYGITFNKEEGELALTHINKEAMQNGPINSKLTTPEEPKIDWNAIPGVIKLKVIEESGVKYISVMVNDKEAIMFNFDFMGRNTWIDIPTAAKLYQSKTIGKKDFADGDKFKAEGVKFPSNQFEFEKMQLGETVVTGAKFKISDKAEYPTLGKAFFKQFKDWHEEGGFIYLVPKPERGKKQ